jgi:catechol 2,3-dioxygenase-like lactoylglutathione lyase family enzyme
MGPVNTTVGRMAYLYVGSADVEGDLAFYRDRLGAEVVWDRQAMGTHVAAVRLGEGPLVLLADHRQPGAVLPIWTVDDLDGVQAVLRERGWTGPATRVEVPDGPCLLLADPSGNEVGLLQQVRPGILEPS